jgi:hypothetical protein
MNPTDAIPVVTALISGVLGGVIVAVVNHFLTRNKQNAEIEKLRAETEKIRAETSKLNSNVTDLSSAVHEQLTAGEQILYDSLAGMDLHDFNTVEGRAYDPVQRTHSGPKGTGNLTVVDDTTLNLQRTNAEGRFEIHLDRYTYDGKNSAVIPANELLAGNRKLRVSFEAKAVDASHELDVLLKDGKTGAVPLIKTVRVERNEWTPFHLYFQISPRVELVLRIYDTRISRAPSSLQLRSLVVAERAS